LNEQGQFKAVGALVTVLIWAVIVSEILKLGDLFKLSGLIFAVFALLLVFIGLKYG
jgi:hypothetical protein